MTVYFAAFLAAALLAYLLTPLCIKLAAALTIYDFPNDRKIHTLPIPQLGGIALFLAVVGGLVFLATFFPWFLIHRSHIEGIIIGGAVLVALGLWDDLHGTGAAVKLAFQALVAGLMYYVYDIRLEAIANPFGASVSLGIFGVAVTVFWYVLLINAINLIDGLDGLAAGITLIAAATIFLLSVSWASPFALCFALILGGAALGFLPYNFFPARVFMGDAGSFFLGFALATLTMLTTTKTPALLALMVPLTALALPLVDTLFAFLRRIRARRHPFRADRRHLHHRLLGCGLSHRGAVVIMYYLSAFSGALALLIFQTSRLAVWIILLMLVGGFALLLETLQRLEVMRNRSEEIGSDSQSMLGKPKGKV